MTCVAHSFATALYCAERWANSKELPDFYPNFSTIFSDALLISPDRARGVSFDAIARGLETVYADRIRRLGLRYQPLPSSNAAVRRTLLKGMAVIAGYQVNAAIDAFHRHAYVCEQMGYVLPAFRRSDKSLSGHAVLLLGYDFGVQAFIARNSWGPAWGVDGHFLIPFASIRNQDAITDLWALLS